MSVGWCSWQRGKRTSGCAARASKCCRKNWELEWSVGNKGDQDDHYLQSSPVKASSTSHSDESWDNRVMKRGEKKCKWLLWWVLSYFYTKFNTCIAATFDKTTNHAIYNLEVSNLALHIWPTTTRGTIFKYTHSGGFSHFKKLVSSTIRSCNVSESNIGRRQIDWSKKYKTSKTTSCKKN